MIEMNLLVVFNVDQQLGNRHPELRMDHLRRDLAQRNQHKFAIGHLRMRHPQIFFFTTASIVQQDIKSIMRAPQRFLTFLRPMARSMFLNFLSSMSGLNLVSISIAPLTYQSLASPSGSLS